MEMAACWWRSFGLFAGSVVSVRKTIRDYFLHPQDADAILRKSRDGSEQSGDSNKASFGKRGLLRLTQFDRLTNGRSEVSRWQESEAGWHHQSLPETLDHEVDEFSSR
jgi:hypothetical protein